MFLSRKSCKHKFSMKLIRVGKDNSDVYIGEYCSKCGKVQHIKTVAVKEEGQPESTGPYRKLTIREAMLKYPDLEVIEKKQI